MINDKKKILKELEKIFQTLFDNQNIKLTLKTKSKDIKGWDSLTHINLILSIEKLFNFRFNPKDIYSFQNMNELVDNILNKINDKK